MEHEGGGGSEGSAGLLQQILSLKLVPRVGNGTLCPNATSLCSFPGTGGRLRAGLLPCECKRGSRRPEIRGLVFLLEGRVPLPAADSWGLLLTPP